jgi:hypothetical protein
VITAEGTTLERNINFEAGFMPCGSKVYEREYNFPIQSVLIQMIFKR